MSTDKTILKEINDALKWHCESNFTKGYHKTVKALVNKLKKNKEFSMDSGKYLGWVAGILYVVGEDSDLFNPDNNLQDKLYYTKTELADGVGISMTTMKSRAQDIRDALPENSKFEADITYIYDNDVDDNFGKWVKEVNFKDIEKYRIYMEKAMKSQTYEDTVSYLEKAIEEAEGKPYLYLKNDLAYVHFSEGEFDKAIKEYEEILNMDKEDSLNVRFNLANIFILADKNEEFEKLIAEYEEDNSTFMSYAKSLYYLKNKDTRKARQFIKKAFKANIYVPRFLLDLEMLELPMPDKYEEGDKVEAMHYYELASEAWITVEKSLYWLLDEYYKYVAKNDIKEDYKKADALEDVQNIYKMLGME